MLHEGHHQVSESGLRIHITKKEEKRIKENKGKRELTLTKLADNSIQSKEKSDS